MLFKKNSKPKIEDIKDKLGFEKGGGGFGEPFILHIIHPLTHRDNAAEAEGAALCPIRGVLCLGGPRAANRDSLARN